MVEAALGPFVLHQRIAAGGMGEVWGGVHGRHGLPVAVKVVTEARDPDAVRAFGHEVRAVAGLSHPCIVVVLDYGLVGPEAEAATEGALVAGSPYLAMERAEGILQRTAGWTETRALLLQVLDALAHAHARGVVHRDLKPGNLLRFGDVHKLADFGLARPLAADPVDRSVGTPGYMAPEQWLGAWRDYGPWTDLYALGCLAWKLVTGARPFRGRDAGTLRGAHLLADPGPLEPAFPVPAGLEAWLRQLLAKEVAARYRRAADAAWDLLQLPPPPRSGGNRRVRQGADLPTLVLAAPTLVQPLMAAAPTRLPGPPGPRTAARPPPLPGSWRIGEQLTPGPQLVGAGLGLYPFRLVRLVGRHLERDELWGHLRAVCDGAGARAVVLRGPAGTGKSRLARWLALRAHEVGVATVLQVPHGPHHGGLVSLLTERLRSDGLTRDALVQRVQRDHPQAHPAEVDRLVELVRPRASGEGSGPRPLAVEERWEVLHRWLGWLAAERALVIHIEDAQWGSDSLRFVERALDVGDLRALVLVSVRDEALRGQPGAVEALSRLERRPDAWPLALGPLTGAERSELVRELLGLRAELADDVERRTAGNPLFAVQLVGDWVHRGLLEATQDGFALREGADPRIPRALHDLWVTRVEAVLEDRDVDRTALEIAAVLGSAVELDTWRATCARAGAEARDPLLEALYRHQLVHAHPRGFAFVHTLLVESLVLGAEASGRLRSHRDHASAELEEVGVRWMDRGEPLRAVGLLQRALALCDSADRRVTIEMGLGHGHRILGRTDDALTHLESCLASYRQAGDRRGEAVALRGIGSAVMMQGRLEASEAAYREALALHRADGDRAMEGVTLGNLGIIYKKRGQLELALAHYTEAIARHREAGNERSEGIVQGNLGNLLQELGRVDEARDAFEAAHDLNVAVGDRRGQAIVVGNLGTLHREQGRVDEARTHYETALALHREIGDRRFEAIVLGNLGNLEVEVGRRALARERYVASLALYEETGDRHGVAVIRGNLASWLFEEGAHDRARDEARAAVEQFRELGEPIGEGVFLGVLAEIEAGAGDPEEGVRLIAEARGLLAGAGSRSELGLLACRRARIARLTGDEVALTASLAEAEVVADEVRAGPRSDLRRQIAEVGGPEPG